MIPPLHALHLEAKVVDVARITGGERDLFHCQDLRGGGVGEEMMASGDNVDGSGVGVRVKVGLE